MEATIYYREPTYKHAEEWKVYAKISETTPERIQFIYDTIRAYYKTVVKWPEECLKIEVTKNEVTKNDGSV